VRVGTNSSLTKAQSFGRFCSSQALSPRTKDSCSSTVHRPSTTAFLLFTGARSDAAMLPVVRGPGALLHRLSGLRFQAPEPARAVLRGGRCSTFFSERYGPFMTSGLRTRSMWHKNGVAASILPLQLPDLPSAKPLEPKRSSSREDRQRGTSMSSGAPGTSTSRTQAQVATAGLVVVHIRICDCCSLAQPGSELCGMRSDRPFGHLRVSTPKLDGGPRASRRSGRMRALLHFRRGAALKVFIPGQNQHSSYTHHAL
jgi:hypothetical protein